MTETAPRQSRHRDIPVPWKVAEELSAPPPSRIRVGGLLGSRMAINVQGRLLAVDEEGLLRCFRKRTASSDFANAWAGEHAGKFLSAACRSLVGQPDGALHAKAARVAAGLLAAQEDDGYLGTYVAGDRWTGWDVWVHKYVLAGLLAWYRLSGQEEVIQASRRIGLLLADKFGGQPSGIDINGAGWFFGMAATSVLEPICDLYRMTGEKRFLDFARAIAAAWDRPGGAQILSALQAGGLDDLPSGKAYEFISNLNGLLDLYRLTAEEQMMKIALKAWADMRDAQLYPTGSLSAMEHFQPHGEARALPSSNLAETCVTVTWLQFNERLLRLTGEPRFGAECERTILNHLLAAQDGANGDFAYYTALCGSKEFTDYPLCCVSSGPRAIAAIADHVWAVSQSGLTINIFAESRLQWSRGGIDIVLSIESRFPAELDATIRVDAELPLRFTLQMRVPDWATKFTAKIGAETWEGERGTMLTIDREWLPGTSIAIEMACEAESLPISNGYPDRAMLRYGPQLLTLDADANPDIADLDSVSIDAAAIASLRRSPTDGDRSVFTMSARCRCGDHSQARAVKLVPFADARRHNMLLRTSADIDPAPLTLWARAYTSRIHVPEGILGEEAVGSLFVGEFVTDGRYDTVAVLDMGGFDVTTVRAGASSDVGPAWIALAFDRPLLIGAIRFRHGTADRSRWFIAPPRVSLASCPVPIQTIDPGVKTRWDSLGSLPAYVEALRDTVTDPEFILPLSRPRISYGIRIDGAPKTGILSCAELAGLA